MASKRQNGDPAESTTTAKKTKTDKSEFTGTVFKSTLKDSTKALKGTLSVTYFSWLVTCLQLKTAHVLQLLCFIRNCSIRVHCNFL